MLLCHWPTAIDQYLEIWSMHAVVFSYIFYILKKMFTLQVNASKITLIAEKDMLSN